jgi:DNA-binding transcriptional LysR family regulator
VIHQQKAVDSSTIRENLLQRAESTDRTDDLSSITGRGWRTPVGNDRRRSVLVIQAAETQAFAALALPGNPRGRVDSEWRRAMTPEPSKASAASGSRGSTFRVAFVPGVTLDKWGRIWNERVPQVRLVLSLVERADQLAVLQDGRADIAFVRLPVEHQGIHLIPLYRETPVVVASSDHPLAAFHEVSVGDLDGEHLLQAPDSVREGPEPPPDPPPADRAAAALLTTKQAIETAAAGTGVLVVPLSVARLYHRKDVVYRPIADLAESQVGLAWMTASENPLVDVFIGVVRGRTSRSSRSDQVPHHATGSKPKSRGTYIGHKRTSRRSE